MSNDAFIKVDEDGNVAIQGGVFLTPEIAIDARKGKYPHRIEIKNCVFLNYIPERWDLIGWLKLRRIIMQWTKDKGRE